MSPFETWLAYERRGYTEVGTESSNGFLLVLNSDGQTGVRKRKRGGTRGTQLSFLHQCITLLKNLLITYLASPLSWHPHKKWQISPLITTTKKQLLISEMGKASETLRAQGISFLLMKAFRSWSPFKSLLSVASCLFMIALQHIAISACGGHEGHTPLKNTCRLI